MNWKDFKRHLPLLMTMQSSVLQKPLMTSPACSTRRIWATWWLSSSLISGTSAAVSFVITLPLPQTLIHAPANRVKETADCCNLLDNEKAAIVISRTVINKAHF